MDPASETLDLVTVTRGGDDPVSACEGIFWADRPRVEMEQGQESQEA